MFIENSYKKNFFIYMSLSFLCFLFLISSESRAIIFLKDVENTIFYPFRLVVRGVKYQVSVVTDFLKDTDENKDILIKKLTLELESYKQEIINHQSTEEENKRLRDILDLSTRKEYIGIVAEVIDVDYIYSYSYISINKGRLDGIVEDLPVITFINGVKSVVGIISETTLFTSKIRTIKNELNSIGAYLPSVNTHSVVSGLGGSSKDIQLLYIDKVIPISVGDQVFTSSNSHLFPPNLLIGDISSIDNTQKTSTTYQVYVRPSVSFEKLSEVFIMKPKTKKR